MEQTKKSKYTRIILLFTAACFIGLGIYFGGYFDALANAARICLSCMGIG
ncbi:hypothetical protein [Christensenella intestinihominis]|nr:hypothetical protein [Christensenella intestinihominis]